MKFGAAIPVANEWRFMPAVIGQLLAGGVERVLIMRGRTSLSGAEMTLTAAPELDPRVEIVEGTWASEADTRNAGIAMLPDCDYVLSVDSDEIFCETDLDLIFKTCKLGLLAVLTRMTTYWKTPRCAISPPEQLPAVVATRGDARFRYLRQVSAAPNSLALINRPVMHHLSYVRTDEEVQEKLRLFGHAKEIVPGWYERVWKGWDQNPQMENLHPTHPPAYRRAITVKNDLEAILSKWGCS